MGLDTTHGCYHGGYGGFQLFRQAIAKAAGYPTSGRPYFVDIDYEPYAQKNFQGEWDTTPEDILLVLIVHSDCDGVIKNEHCAPLADRIEALIPTMEDGDRGWKGMAQDFVNGLRDAASAGEDVGFF